MRVATKDAKTNKKNSEKVSIFLKGGDINKSPGKTFNEFFETFFSSKSDSSILKNTPNN
jgi:hypothetical protein